MGNHQIFTQRVAARTNVAQHATTHDSARLCQCQPEGSKSMWPSSKPRMPCLLRQRHQHHTGAQSIPPAARRSMHSSRRIHKRPFRSHAWMPLPVQLRSQKSCTWLLVRSNRNASMRPFHKCHWKSGHNRTHTRSQSKYPQLSSTHLWCKWRCHMRPLMF